MPLPPCWHHSPNPLLPPPKPPQIKTEYIGNVGTGEEISCMHGPAECEGNKQQLCLQHHVPRSKNYE